ncbi:MAG: VOC family protein [Allosphingosinicella sp.]|uniref:VOC family protein n=1 Tax=Allosphingosinicella sp. TaxID=2823234 RepID=UPI003950FFE0
MGTDDFNATLAFFRSVLGLRPLAMDERGVAILEVADGQLLEIFGSGTIGKQLTTPPVVAFEVDDVAAAREELLVSGVELIGDVASWNGFEWLYFYGPDRHIYCVKKTPPAGWEHH